MVEAGGNTLRVYDTVNLKDVLDKAQQSNIAVIVDIPIPKFSEYYNLYKDEAFVLQLKQNVKSLVSNYKNHPAVLFWNLGNEITFPFVLKKNEFINTFNDLVDIIHELDTNHLVGTTVSGTSKKQTFSLHWHAPQLDVVGFNAFGNLKDVKSLIQMTSLWTNVKPYYFSEWGIHGPWEEVQNSWSVLVELNSTEKANVLKERYDKYIKTDSRALGSLAFYWGSKTEGTPTWFNILDTIGRKSESFYALQNVWLSHPDSINFPFKVENLKLDGYTKNTPLIFTPNTATNAKISFEYKTDSVVKFDWLLYKEAWGKQQWTNLKALVFESCGQDHLQFNTPSEEGPYRLFVKAYDANNNFSTANVPFYVLKVND